MEKIPEEESRRGLIYRLPLLDSSSSSLAPPHTRPQKRQDAALRRSPAPPTTGTLIPSQPPSAHDWCTLSSESGMRRLDLHLLQAGELPEIWIGAVDGELVGKKKRKRLQCSSSPNIVSSPSQRVTAQSPSSYFPVLNEAQKKQAQWLACNAKNHVPFH